MLRIQISKHVQGTQEYRLLNSWRTLMLGFTVNLLLLHWASCAANTLVVGAPTTPSNAVIPHRKLQVVRGENASIVCISKDSSSVWFYELNEQRIIRQPSNEILLIDRYTALLIVRNAQRQSIYQCRSNITILDETNVLIDTSNRKLELGIKDVGSITCNSNDSKRTYFYEVNTKRYFNHSSSSDVIRIDDYTSVLLIRNASAQMSIYHCKIDRAVINESRVYVGTPPHNVTNFECRVFDYVNMTCTFAKPQNMLYTQYRVKYSIGSTSEQIYTCELHENGNMLYFNLPSQQNSCVYLPSHKFYNFNLMGKNTLGINSQYFSVNNHRSVIPEKLHINITNITTNSVSLAWMMSHFFYYQERGLVYDVQIRPRGITEHIMPVTEHFSCNNTTANCWMTLSNLKYPYWEYNMTVRAHTNNSRNALDNRWNELQLKAISALTNNSNELDDGLWSVPYIASFITKARRPDWPPHTAFGSFYIDPKEVEIRLYWRQLSKFEENGPNFHYNISEIDEQGNILNHTTTNESSVIFAWRRENTIYSIRSVNDEGQSEGTSIIHAFATFKDADTYAPTNINHLYHDDRTYTLSWKEPTQFMLMTNYTVFWCRARIESLNQCNGTIHFKYLNRTQVTYTTEPQDHSLILAVSANYPNWSTGMRWVRCSAAESVDLVKLEPEVKNISALEILLNWSTEHICTSVIEGYNITYCQVQDTTNEEITTHNSSMDNERERVCLSEITTVKLTGNKSEYKNFSIQHLKPYSMYRIEMLMYSHLKVGPMSDPLYIRTSEAAPSEPIGLYVDKSSVTSNSANIFWNPPIVRNGRLRNYTVWWRTNDNIDKKILNLKELGVDEDNNMTYTLTGLSSYSKYEIFVTAHTVSDSPASASVTLETLIGIPSHPRHVTITGDGSTKTIEWEDPEKPSGRVEIYEIALVTTFAKNKTSNSNIFDTENVEQLTYVTGGLSRAKHSCTFQAPDCSGATYSYRLRVRAINVIPEHDLDKTTFRVDTALKRERRNTSMEMKTNSTIHEKLTIVASKTGSLVDIGASTITAYYLPSKKFECNGYLNMDIIKNISSSTHYGLESVWETSVNRIQCAETKWDYVLYIAFGILPLVCALVVFVYWLHQKYNKMKNIEAILPEGLLQHMSTNAKICSGGIVSHGYDNRLEKELPEISNNFDFFTSKEDCHLLNSRNALNTLTSTGSENGDSDSNSSRVSSNNNSSNREEHGSSGQNVILGPDRKIEQLSDNTDTIELNDTSSPSYHQSPLKTTDLSATANGYLYLSECAIAKLNNVANKEGEEPPTIAYSKDSSDTTYLSSDDTNYAGGAVVKIENNALQKNVSDGRCLNFSGYVTPASMMLAGVVSAGQPTLSTTLQSISMPSSTLPTTPNGDLMPDSILRLKGQDPTANKQQIATTNGYIALDALADKLNAQTIPLNLAEVSAQPKLHNDTQPTLCDNDNIQCNNANTSLSMETNNKNDVISGYVSQRQLAEFGQLLH